MKVEVLLRDQAGVEKVHAYDCEPEYRDSLVFMWEDGNYACDCNRSIFLHELNFDEAWPCSNGKIKVVWLKCDGEQVYSEA